MSVTLGGIALGVAYGDELALRGLRADTVAIETQRSEGGVLQVLVAPMEGGRSLELEGVLTIAQVDAVLALSSSGSPVALVHPQFSGQVLITGTDGFPDAGIEYTNPAPTSWLAGSIYLLEV